MRIIDFVKFRQPIRAIDQLMRNHTNHFPQNCFPGKFNLLKRSLLMSDRISMKGNCRCIFLLRNQKEGYEEIEMARSGLKAVSIPRVLDELESRSAILKL